MKKSALGRQLSFEYCLNRAHFLAGAAINASFFVNYVDIAFADAVNGAFRLTGSASDTSIGNESWHFNPPLNCVNYIIYCFNGKQFTNIFIVFSLCL